jgi:hypothetical protein
MLVVVVIRGFMEEEMQSLATLVEPMVWVYAEDVYRHAQAFCYVTSPEFRAHNLCIANNAHPSRCLLTGVVKFSLPLRHKPLPSLRPCAAVVLYHSCNYTLLEIESEIPIYRTRRRCFILRYEFAFSFVYVNFPSRISMYKWKFSSEICKRFLQDSNSYPYG